MKNGPSRSHQSKLGMLSSALIHLLHLSCICRPGTWHPFVDPLEESWHETSLIRLKLHCWCATTQGTNHRTVMMTFKWFWMICFSYFIFLYSWYEPCPIKQIHKFLRRVKHAGVLYHFSDLPKVQNLSSYECSYSCQLVLDKLDKGTTVKSIWIKVVI